MEKMTSIEFNAILNHEPNFLGYDYLFYNIDKERLSEIKESIKERTIPNIADIIVTFDKEDLENFEHIIATITENAIAAKKIMLSTYLSTLICKELFDYQLMHNEHTNGSFIQSNIQANDNLKICKNIKEYTDAFCKCDSFDSDTVYSFIREHRNDKFVFHFFITKEMKIIDLQKEINHYIGQYNGIFHTRIYTENDSLISYCNSIGAPIEIGHDYYDFNDIENNPILKQKKLPR